MFIRFFFAFIIILYHHLLLVSAKNSYGAQQNVEGMDVENGQPNVVMQSVVFGKNGKKQENNGYDADELVENHVEMDGAIRNILKQLCPCMDQRMEEDDEDYSEDYSDSFDNLSIQRLAKVYNNNNKRNRFKKYNENNSRRNMEDLFNPSYNRFRGRIGRVELPLKSRWIRRNTRMLPQRYRTTRRRNPRLRNMKYLDEMEECDDFKDKPKRRKYDQDNNWLNEEDDCSDVDSDHENGLLWNRPDQCISRRRKKHYTPDIERHSLGEDWRQRYNNWPVEGKSTNGLVPQDILYVPDIDKPYRRRSKPSASGPQWSAECL